MSAWVYVLRCRDGSLYTGWTNRLEMRLRAHQAGKGSKYTRSRLPICLVAAWRMTRPAKLVKLKRWGETKSAARVRSRATLCFS
ncbi:MAG: GIY-YIG nuclease family protein [Verrucomicrobia bacterium]|nr:GIY-YIG nuclease family protein [Verrucomicrobiota bacterium]